MKTLILSLFIILTLSCNNNDNESQTNVPTPIPTPTTIISTLVGKGSTSHPTPPLQNTLIINQAQWDAILNTMNAVNNVSNDFTETNIDFNNFDVIAVFRNPLSNSASTVDIISIVENQTERVVTVQNLTNGIAQDVAQPFHIVKVVKSTKPVIFQ